MFKLVQSCIRLYYYHRYNFNISGFSAKIHSKWDVHQEALNSQKDIDIPSLPGTKGFKPKCKLPQFSNYRDKADNDY